MAGLPANISYHSTYITLELCWLIIDLVDLYVPYTSSMTSSIEINASIQLL